MSYTVSGVDYNEFSAINQRIIDRLVSREVYCCMTQEVEYMLERVFCGDDNNPFDESAYDEIFVCDSDDGEEYERIIYEWWVVSGWLGDKLREKGQPVISTVWGNTYWGRTCTGQSICLDWCITEIAKDMEILDGMEYSWSDKK